MHDSQLLEDYVTRNSEAAFQLLVSRYLILVRSTALRQVRNTPLAEDVAQAVFILLARKAARLRKIKNLVLGGWLYRTTRFVAARALRGELRRQQREQEAFRMQQISSADDTWRRIAPLLDEGLEQLDQTDRNAVILRFFQEESLRAVGGALGISEEAAKKRVSRSLEKLRAFFLRRGFTISTAVLAAGLAGHRGEAAPADLAGAIATKALAHAASSSATLPALVAETLAAWHWAMVKILAASGVAATAAVLLAANTWTTPTPLPVEVPAAKPVPSVASARTRSASATETDANQGWHFSFQAVDAETGKGIAKARIMVESVGDMKQATASPQQIDRQTNLQTDAEGRCDIALPYPKPLMLTVGVVAEGYAERSVVGGEGRPLSDAYVLKVPRGSRIGGVVQDEAGQPVAGAGIQVSFYGSGDSSAREFQRERPGLLNDDSVAATDSAGRWTFGSCSTNSDFYIAVNHPTFPTASFRIEGDARSSPGAAALKLADLQAGEAVMILKAGLNLRGTVTDENGYYIAGAKVSNGRFFPESHSQATDGEGSFALPALPPGENFVTITAEGFAPQRLAVEMTGNTAPLEIKLKRGAVLRLRILDEAGSPVPNASVGLDGWQGPNTLEWSEVTDSGGRITWNSAPLEPINFSVLKDGYFNSRQNNLIADGQEHAITLRPRLTVVGRVTDAGTKQPIASFKAVPGADRSETAYGSNGVFTLTFTEYSPQLTVTIEADGYEPATSQPLEDGAISLICDVQLKKHTPEDAIQGVVLLPDGSPAAGAQVSGSTAYGVPVGKGRLMRSEDFITIQTDADGHFSFAEGFAARGLVAASPSGIGSVAITPANRSVVIQLQPWGRIEGALRLGGQPNAGQSIVLFSPLIARANPIMSLNPGEYTTKTDEQGNFVFEQAPPGSFKLYLSKEKEPFSHDTPVQVQPGATTVAQIGGTGNILSGRLLFSKPGGTIDWSKQLIIAMIQTRLPYPPGSTGRARAEWFQNYEKTEEGRAYIHAVCTYPLVVQADGAFTVEDVLPGDYELSGQLSDATVDLSMGVMGHAIGSFRQDVTVPQPAESQSTEKIDLGTVLVQAENP